MPKNINWEKVPNWPTPWLNDDGSWLDDPAATQEGAAPQAPAVWPFLEGPSPAEVEKQQAEHDRMRFAKEYATIRAFKLGNITFDEAAQVMKVIREQHPEGK